MKVINYANFKFKKKPLEVLTRIKINLPTLGDKFATSIR